MILSSCGALVALALVAGGYYWWGGPHERRVAQRVLDEACEGVLPSREMRDVLGEGPFETGPGRVDVLMAGGASDDDGSSDHGDHGGDEEHGGDEVRGVTCSVSGDGVRMAGGNTNEAEVTVTVQSVPQRRDDDTGADVDRAAGRGYDDGPLYPRLSAELPPVGLGGGRRGMFTTDEGFSGDSDGSGATAVTLLDCARDRGSLLVTVAAKDEDVTLDDPHRRTAFARIATATAAKASAKWGCDAEPGEPPRAVALPVNADESVRLADAAGTCRGVPGRGPGRGGRLSRVWESASSDAPVEVCVVAGEQPELPDKKPSDGGRRYHLVASYGPYAEIERLAYERRHGEYTDKPGPGEAPAGRLAGGGHWASAACRDGSGPALFTVRDGEAWEAERSGAYKRRRTKPAAADPAYERAALAEFARRSARTHGCETPKLP
ncbi:hypothetical protein AB0N81_00410 [Streptomyces sp. NPDC093510]|uniref:hypothetical protein n=1 Tax=Streptomyces sp. NPDC093510 TaxID=3155199 RepID=UPI003428AF18